MNVAHIDDLDRIVMDDGFVWRPIRRRFGIRAFGVNAYSPSEQGAQVVEEHTENRLGHEEMYLVLRGRALFTVDGNEHELGPGQLVFLRDPSLKRSAIGLTEDTIVLAIGGRPGVPHEPSAWEAMFAAVPASREGDWAEAIRISEQALVEQPDHPGLLYNLACFESRGGRPLQAITHLTRAIEQEPQWRDYAAKDVDFDPIRREPAFPS